MLTSRGCALALFGVLVLGVAGPGGARAADELAPAVAEVTARIAELSGMLEENPNDVERLVDLGNVYYENNMLDQALELYARAVAVDSTHAGVRLNLGALLADLGQLDRSVVELNLARELEPGSALIVSTLGSTYYGQGEYSDAVEMYRQAIRLDPRSVEGHFNLGVAFADVQMFDEAIREWQDVIAIDPEGTVAEVCRENIRMMSEFLGK